MDRYLLLGWLDHTNEFSRVFARVRDRVLESADLAGIKRFKRSTE
jgi:hypothetical protein